MAANVDEVLLHLANTFANLGSATAQTPEQAAGAQAVSERAGEMQQAIYQKKLQKAQEKKKKGGMFGDIGSLFGTALGIALAPATGGASLAIPAATSAAGSAVGQLAGGGSVNLGQTAMAGLSGGMGAYAQGARLKAPGVGAPNLEAGKLGLRGPDATMQSIAQEQGTAAARSVGVSPQPNLAQGQLGLRGPGAAAPANAFDDARSFGSFNGTTPSGSSQSMNDSLARRGGYNAPGRALPQPQAALSATTPEGPTVKSVLKETMDMFLPQAKNYGFLRLAETALASEYDLPHVTPPLGMAGSAIQRVRQGFMEELKPKQEAARWGAEQRLREKGLGLQEKGLGLEEEGLNIRRDEVKAEGERAERADKRAENQLEITKSYLDIAKEESEQEKAVFNATGGVEGAASWAKEQQQMERAKTGAAISASNRAGAGAETQQALAETQLKAAQLELKQLESSLPKDVMSAMTDTPKDYGIVEVITNPYTGKTEKIIAPGDPVLTLQAEVAVNQAVSDLIKAGKTVTVTDVKNIRQRVQGMLGGPSKPLSEQPQAGPQIIDTRPGNQTSVYNR